ncbi:serine hydrolase domain-containing protein [Actinomycetospora straminea]|uniref:Serine hydrolase domain-containing protein n=1 Tax=Actinomycetospora straminea TaxID=663607 RepID=A0ABP9E5F6_9PSEU|nr:serine hydrolase domain-containing protein [Actinomycetospora straminea]MDD7932758.1 serine hydrolase [Actinomycetospora straminea]
MPRSIDGAGIDRVLSSAVERGGVPHVAAIAADADGVIYEGAAGVRLTDAGPQPVSTSTHFRIMSMTKMVATAAALQQVERGELDISQPVADYVPEFADLPVLDGFDGDTPRLRAPTSQATVKHLITHTSGLSYWFWNADLKKYEDVTGLPNVVPGDLAAFGAPLVADPGTKFEYGINTDWLGKVVEKVAGTTLDVVIKEGITGPLGMDDTMFALDDGRQANKTAVHVRGEDGTWGSAGNVLPDDPQWWAGGHGLHSTPRDYIRFERALLRGGELDGVRILDEATVDAAFTDQLDGAPMPTVIESADASITGTLTLGEGWTWGYGLLLNTVDLPGARRAWTGAWAGLFNTHFFVDRSTGVCASIYTNSLPFITDEAWQLYGDVEAALYSSL